MKKVATFIPTSEIKKKVKMLSEKISSAYPNGLIVIGILKGSFIFMADLVRHLTCPVFIDFIKVSSYKGKETTGKINLELSYSLNLRNKDVLIVEDIVDTGITLSWICEYIKQQQPKSLKICCLLDKPERRKVEIKPDYVGFTIPDRFVVGYGLDYEEKHRSLPYIGAL